MTDIARQMDERAKADAPSLLDLSRVGEKSAELMFEEVIDQLRSPEAGLSQQEVEKAANRYINHVNQRADRLSDADQAKYPYNLNFEIVDDNKDGKWNLGEKMKVHNESRYWFRQPEAFSPDGIPDIKNDADAILKERAQLKRAGY